MKVEGMEFSNFPGINKSQKMDAELGDFLAILNPLIVDELAGTILEEDAELIDLMVGEEGEKEEENDDELALMSNMIWMGTREIKTSPYQEDSLEEVGQVSGDLMDKTDLINLDEIENFFNEDRVIMEGQVDKITWEENLEKSMNGESNEGIDKDGIKFPEKAEVNFEDRINNQESQSIFREATSKVEKQDEIGIGDLTKEDVPKEGLGLGEKDRDLRENQWTNLLSREVQKNNMESHIEAEFQEEVLSTENIVRVSESIIKLMETSTQGDTKVMKVKLYPEELGNVDITLKMEEGQLIAKILVDNDHVRQLFTNNIQELNQNLIRQNIHIGDMQVDLNNNSHGNQEQDGRNQFKPNKSINIGDRSIRETSSREVRVSPGEISVLA